MYVNIEAQQQPLSILVQSNLLSILIIWSMKQRKAYVDDTSRASAWFHTKKKINTHISMWNRKTESVCRRPRFAAESYRLILPTLRVCRVHFSYFNSICVYLSRWTVFGWFGPVFLNFCVLFLLPVLLWSCSLSLVDQCCY